MSESRAVESCGESYAAAELNKCAFQAVRTLFSVGLNMFYNHVEVAGSHYVPSKNQPTILFANHSNSLTDAITLLSCTPRIVRFTAKDTLWRSPWFSVFVKGAGTVPIMRRKDHSGQPVSNHRAFKALREVSCVPHGKQPTQLATTMAFAQLFVSYLCAPCCRAGAGAGRMCLHVPRRHFPLQPLLGAAQARGGWHCYRYGVAE